MKILTKKAIARKHFQRFSYPKDMDVEMIDFMDVLNNIPGCRTMYCCQGHGHGGWYFVVNCCNMTPYNELKDYFELKQRDNQQIRVLDGIDYAFGAQVEEHQLTVYDQSFDKQTDSKKKSAYKEMCEHFLKLMPRKHW